MTDKKPSEIATENQIIASNPLHSAWVSASAGSGKTKVLVQRILRLLLNNTNPQSILGITYTKAAAAEMQNRINKELQHWAICDGKKLDKSLTKELGTPPTQDHITTARSLFAKVLDTPGGIKMQTIHSFCQSLLAQFPLESGVSVGFKVLEKPDKYRQQAIYTLSQNTQCIPHLQQVMKYGDKNKINTTLNWVFANQADFKRLYKDRTTPYHILGISADDTLEIYQSALVSDFKQQVEVLKMFQNKIAGNISTKSVAKYYNAIDGVMKSPLSFDIVQSFFEKVCKKDSTDFSVGRTHILIDNIDILNPVAQVYKTYQYNIRALNIAQNTESLVYLAEALVAEYTRQKQQDNVLDFNDIIYKTKNLLSRVGIAEWVTYKTDRGQDHILLDESQDTSPDQWQIMRAIIEPFFEQENQQTDIYPDKTVFAVGDDKQSIYGFQGADPQGFFNNKEYFEKIANANQYAFKNIQLNVSFRTVPAILQWVDNTMGACDPEYNTCHIAHRANDYGRVELLPVLYTQNNMPIKAPTVYAQEIAYKIVDILKKPTYLPSKNRNATAGDILVLVPKRSGVFVNNLNRALNTAGVAVAGNDRLKLYDDIAIKDLLAVLQFIILPNDDLTLACVLKSPLIGLTDEQIFEFAHNRGSKTLLTALRECEKHSDIYKYIQRFLNMADIKRPFEILNTLLNSDCCLSRGAFTGRQAFVARLGIHVHDVLEEILRLAMDFEQDTIPTIQGFIDMINNDSNEIKRDAESSQNTEVRIMTVHGAKGLESPIVIVPDAYRKPSFDLDFVFNMDKTKMLVAYNKDEQAIAQKALGVIDVEKQKQLAESHRLLYVAMTRAEDILICGGFGRPHSEWCWYDALQTSIAKMGQQDSYVPYENTDIWASTQFGKLSKKRYAPDTNTDIWADESQTSESQTKQYGVYRYVYTYNDKPHTSHIVSQQKADSIQKYPIPDWATTDAEPESATARPLNPHRPEDIFEQQQPPAPSPLSVQGDINQLYKRGNIMHNALQHITAVQADKRKKALNRYLQTPSFALSAQTQKQYAEEILAVIQNYPYLFAKNTRAEVPVAGIITVKDKEKDKDVAISGIIDRLCVTDDTVWIVDFKSNRPPVTDIDKVPPVYKQQVKIYGDLLAKIYPNHTIRTALLWTFNCQLLEIPR